MLEEKSPIIEPTKKSDTFSQINEEMKKGFH
jgi:hypothetical protein